MIVTMMMMGVLVICVYDCNNDDDVCIDLRAYDLERNVIKLKRVYYVIEMMCVCMYAYI